MATMLDLSKATSRMTMTPALFRALLADVGEDDAHRLRDGTGWNLVEIMAHMRDIDAVFLGRARRIVAEDAPTYAVVDPDALAAERRYDAATLAETVAAFEANRAEFLAFLSTLSAEQAVRTAVHPETGPHTLADLAINTALHDMAHLHQILKAKGQA